MFKLVDAAPASSTNSTLASRIIEIPDVSLNEKLIPANDNCEPSALSIENLKAGSILAPRDYTKPDRSPLVTIALLCLVVLAAVIARLAI
jgi:hypothetical protein